MERSPDLANLSEFVVQAIPCYIYMICFALRYSKIKDVGIPNRQRVAGRVTEPRSYGVFAVLIAIRLF